MKSSTDRIEKEILIRAPLSEVWRAVSDVEEFGSWFGVALKGEAFATGKRVQGHITHPGYEHLIFDVTIEQMIPEQLISWRWHPAAIDPDVDYSKEPTTLVVLELKETGGGTLVSLVETGFDDLTAARRPEAYRMNNEGWDQQMTNIDRHVDKSMSS